MASRLSEHRTRRHQARLRRYSVHAQRVKQADNKLSRRAERSEWAERSKRTEHGRRGQRSGKGRSRRAERGVLPSSNERRRRATWTGSTNGTQTQVESQQGLSKALIEANQTLPGFHNYLIVRTVSSNTRRMFKLWTSSVTAQATQLLIFQACSWGYHKKLNGDYARICIVRPQLSSQCSHFSRSSKQKNRSHKSTTYVYCMLPKKKTRLYKKLTKVYHASFPKNTQK